MHHLRDSPMLRSSCRSGLLTSLTMLCGAMLQHQPPVVSDSCLKQAPQVLMLAGRFGHISLSSWSAQSRQLMLVATASAGSMRTLFWSCEHAVCALAVSSRVQAC